MTSVNSATAAAATAGATTKLNADFDMFLKLLTTQMQNQDPLDPMDTSEYTQQLVQFSQVEQSIEQTGTLKSILASLGTQNLTQASSLVGRQVETGSATAGLTATGPAQWAWSADRALTGMTATISDAGGRVVETRSVSADGIAGALAWDGLTAAGSQLAPGSYTLSLEGLDPSGNKIPVSAHAMGIVSDVRLSNGAVEVTINGMQIAASELVRIGQ